MCKLISKRIVGCYVMIIVTVVQMISASITSMAYTTENETDYFEDAGCLCDKYHLSEDIIHNYSVVDVENNESEIAEGDSIGDSILRSKMSMNAQYTAADNSCGENLQYEIQDGVLTITGTGAMYDFDMYMTPWASEDISEVIIGDGVTYIGIYSFYNKGIREVSISDTVTHIGQLAFGRCKQLENVIIPEGVVTIDHGAFIGCTLLSTVVLPNTLTTIKNNVFKECSSLIEISVPESVTRIGGNVFEGTEWLIQMRELSSFVIINNILIDGKNSEGDIVIPDNVRTIVGGAFSSCDTLESVVIPDNVETILNNSFNDCKNLQNVVVSSAKSAENILIEENAFAQSYILNSDNNYIYFNTLNGDKILYRYIGSDNEIFVDNDVNGICSYAFLGENAEDSKSASVIIHINFSELTSINKYALKNCAISEILLDNKVLNLNDLKFEGKHFSTEISSEKMTGYTFDNKTVRNQLMLAVFENREYTYKLTNNYCRTVINEEILPMIKEINDSSDIVKVKVVYDWMKERYDTGMFFENPTSNKDAHRWLTHYPEGLIVYNYGVCSSFSQMFNIFMNMLNIECYYMHNIGITETVNGQLKKGAHGWNIVKIDGKYYYMDSMNDYFLKSVNGLTNEIFVGFDNKEHEYDRIYYLDTIKDYIYKVPYIEYDFKYDENFESADIVINDDEYVVFDLYINDEVQYEDYQYTFSEYLEWYMINDQTGSHYWVCGEYENIKPYLFQFDYETTSTELLVSGRYQKVTISGSDLFQDNLTINYKAEISWIHSNCNKIQINITPEYHCETITVSLTNYTNNGVYYIVTMKENGKIYQRTYHSNDVIYLLNSFESIDFYSEDGTYLCSLNYLFAYDENGIISVNKGGYSLSTRLDGDDNYTVNCTLYELGDITMNGIIDGNDSLTLLKYLIGRYNFIQTGSTGNLVLGNGNINVNGDISANGTFTLNATNANINGQLSATTFMNNVLGNLNMNRPVNDITITSDYVTAIFSEERMNQMFFNENSIVTVKGNYENNHTNINLSEDYVVEGAAVIDGNVNINSNFMTEGNIVISGDVQNINGSVIYSIGGDITLDSNNININGFIYAPDGTVTIKGSNVTIKGTIIAEELIIEGNSVNFNVAAIDSAVGNGSNLGDMTLTEFQLMLGDMDLNEKYELLDVVAINRKIHGLAI